MVHAMYPCSILASNPDQQECRSPCPQHSNSPRKELPLLSFLVEARAGPFFSYDRRGSTFLATLLRSTVPLSEKKQTGWTGPRGVQLLSRTFVLDEKQARPSFSRSLSTGTERGQIAGGARCTGHSGPADTTLGPRRPLLSVSSWLILNCDVLTGSREIYRPGAFSCARPTTS